MNKSERVTHALLLQILEGRMRPGDVVGTEAKLLGIYGVSRPTLREALRRLEAQGIVELRRGPGGGAVVRAPSLDGLVHAFSVFLYLSRVPFGSVLRAREVIEPALAYEAAIRGEAADFEAMAASIARMRECGDQAGFVAENRVFHQAVARASGNIVLESAWATISLLASGERHGVEYSEANRRHVVAAHEAILAACRGRDAAGAQGLMAAHVGALAQLVRHRYRGLLELDVPVVLGAFDPPPAPPFQGGGKS